MTDFKDQWYAMMRKKYATDNEGIRQIMRERQRKSMESPKRQGKPHKAGFNIPGVAEKAAKISADKRRKNFEESKDTVSDNGI